MGDNSKFVCARLTRTCITGFLHMCMKGHILAFSVLAARGTVPALNRLVCLHLEGQRLRAANYRCASVSRLSLLLVTWSYSASVSKPGRQCSFSAGESSRSPEWNICSAATSRPFVYKHWFITHLQRLENKNTLLSYARMFTGQSGICCRFKDCVAQKEMKN